MLDNKVIQEHSVLLGEVLGSKFSVLQYKNTVYDKSHELKMLGSKNQSTDTYNSYCAPINPMRLHITYIRLYYEMITTDTVHQCIGRILLF